jgi:hypothetical protein
MREVQETKRPSAIACNEHDSNMTQDMLLMLLMISFETGDEED